MRRIFSVNNLEACIFHRARAAFENPNDVDGCLGEVWVRFGDAAQCRERRHLSSAQTRGPTDGERSLAHTDKDERNNLLFTKGSDVRDLLPLMFLIFMSSLMCTDCVSEARHVSQYQNMQ